MTPRQNSSGGKERLGSIPKAGNTYLREPLVVGAMAVVRQAKQGSTKHPWVAQLLERKKPKVAAVTLANKNARIVWAMMARGSVSSLALAGALEMQEAAAVTAKKTSITRPLLKNKI